MVTRQVTRRVSLDRASRNSTTISFYVSASEERFTFKVTNCDADMTGPLNRRTRRERTVDERKNGLSVVCMELAKLAG